MRIGILAVQGAFIEHKHMLDKLNIESFEIRHKKDLEQEMDGLILPGGESTVIGKLVKELELYVILKQKIEAGLPALGTCAGLILLAEHISNDKRNYFGTLPITVKRNAYGRQLGSFQTIEEVKNIGRIPMTFIRAPYVEAIHKDVEILAKVDGAIVAVQYKNQLGVAFHPELTEDISLHKYFIGMVENACNLVMR